ncbi:FadR/GntR family transcriptional regulator [Thalassobaculum sp.]|uniref:FadR/GntR family transcriptional regulator n=1 Tax=Thalassobaculum sp. TaxID=2022740 RepID=UPI0032EFBB7E
MTDQVVPKSSAGLPRQRRRETISEQIKDMIYERGLRPGERLPAERELMEQFQASKGSIREALSALRSQGLIRTRTGPGGGVFLTEIGPQRAMALLSSYFLFRTPTVTDIYDVRCEMEPELAASVAGRLSEADLARLERTMRVYDAPSSTGEEEYAQRMAELDFHTVLAELCPNPVLGLFCGFLQTLLREMAVCRSIYDDPHPVLRDTALHYQIQLMRALKAGDADAARAVMAEHMAAARDYMVRMEASIAGRFLRADDRG